MHFQWYRCDERLQGRRLRSGRLYLASLPVDSALSQSQHLQFPDRTRSTGETLQDEPGRRIPHKRQRNLAERPASRQPEISPPPARPTRRLRRKLEAFITQASARVCCANHGPDRRQANPSGKRLRDTFEPRCCSPHGRRPLWPSEVRGLYPRTIGMINWLHADLYPVK
jgi:hypothetical protein